MNRIAVACLLAGALAGLGCATTVAVREGGPSHPAYLHALADLRHARAHLEAPAETRRAGWDEGTAIRELGAAIHEIKEASIKEASIDDGKNLNDHPGVDARMDWPGRLHRSLELLRRARHDCAEEEDNGFARGLRGRAIQHIDAAIRLTEDAIRANHW